MSSDLKIHCCGSDNSSLLLSLGRVPVPVYPGGSDPRSLVMLGADASYEWSEPDFRELQDGLWGEQKDNADDSER